MITTLTVVSALTGAALAGARGVVTGLPVPEGLAEAYAPRRVALVVGIDQYDDDTLGTLRFAAKDADDVARALEDPDAGHFDVVSVLTGDVPRAAFWSAFESVTRTLHRDDTLVVYIAAHGTLDLEGGTSLYVMGTDGRLDAIRRTGIALSELEAALSDVPARRRVLVLDSCHTGQGRSRLSAADQDRLAAFRGPVPPPVAARVSAAEVRLYSAHLNQPALEDANLQNGVYTHFFVKGLRGAADMDRDGLVEVQEAHHYARDRTLDYTGGTQVPWMESKLVGRESFYISGDPGERKAAERALITGLEALPSRAVITVDGATRGAEAVDPGKRRVQVALDGKTLADVSVRVDAGESIDVGRLAGARSRRFLTMVDTGVRAPSEWLAPVSVGLTGEWLPGDVGGMRPVLGVAASYTVDALPAGGVGGRLGMLWPVSPTAPLGLGVVADVGLQWRVAPVYIPEGADTDLLSAEEKELQGAPSGGLAASMRHAVGHWAVALEPGTMVFQTDEGWAMTPGLRLSTGWLW